MLKKRIALIGLVLITMCLSAVSAQAQTFGAFKLDPATYQKHLRTLPSVRYTGHFNWADQGVVQTARNQGNCGSCWAFATIGALESHIQILDGTVVSLSEQQLVSCDTDANQGCCGGWPFYAVSYFQTQAPRLRSCYPYGDGYTECPTHTGVSCSLSCAPLSYRTSNPYTVYTGNHNQTVSSIYEDGPGVYSYAVYSDFMTYWNSPAGTAPWTDCVYVQQSGALEGYHAIQIIGFDTDDRYWICKNSWGATGGPFGDGTLKIAWDGHLNSLEEDVVNFDIYSLTPTPTSTPTPTQPPVPINCVYCSQDGYPCELLIGGQGLVRDAFTGLGLGGATVAMEFLDGQTQSLTTNPDGSFDSSRITVTVCASGGYWARVEVSAAGYDTHLHEDFFPAEQMPLQLQVDLLPLTTPTPQPTATPTPTAVPTCAPCLQDESVNLVVGWNLVGIREIPIGVFDAQSWA
jgi:hypothetical protein